MCGPVLATANRRGKATGRKVKRMDRRTWPAILVMFVPFVAMAMSISASRLRSSAIEKREGQVPRNLTRSSQFVELRHMSWRPACEEIQPPEALTTPDPLFTPTAHGEKIKVSFIIGTDGRVHSPLILESAGLAHDRRVLQTVRTWRYRPATCNGVPTETEGKVEFSSR